MHHHHTDHRAVSGERRRVMQHTLDERGTEFWSTNALSTLVLTATPRVTPFALMLLCTQAQSGLLEPGVPVYERLYKRHLQVTPTPPREHLQPISTRHVVSLAIASH